MASCIPFSAIGLIGLSKELIDRESTFLLISMNFFIIFSYFF